MKILIYWISTGFQSGFHVERNDCQRGQNKLISFHKNETSFLKNENRWSSIKIITNFTVKVVTAIVSRKGCRFTGRKSRKTFLKITWIFLKAWAVFNTVFTKHFLGTLPLCQISSVSQVLVDRFQMYIIRKKCISNNNLVANEIWVPT